jgi:dsDNA-specific endonuclease/ATPase MutS2
MQTVNGKLSQRDRNTWQNYITNFVDNQDQIAVKYTDNYIPSRKLDLHGYAVNEACVRFKEFITQHYDNGTKTVTIITGKSGQISKEFSVWCERLQIIRSYLPMGNYYDQPGSYKITLAIKQLQK